MDGNFAHLRAEHEAVDADEVTDIEEFLEHHVIHILVFVRADVIACDIYLDAPLGILKFDKRRLTHDAAAHHTASDDYLWLFGFGILTVFRRILEVGFDVCAKSISGVLGCGIRIDTHAAQFLQTLASANLLF